MTDRPRFSWLPYLILVGLFAWPVAVLALIVSVAIARS